MKFKNTLKLLLILLVTASINAQKDCDFTVNKVDDFTGEKVVETKLQKVTSTFINKWDLAVRYEGGDYFIMVRLSAAGDDYFMPVENKFLIKLTDDTVLKSLAPETFTTTRSEYGNYGEYYFNVSRDELDQIYRKGISGLRLYLEDGYQDTKKINTDKLREFQFDITCLFKELDQD